MIAVHVVSADAQIARSGKEPAVDAQRALLAFVYSENDQVMTKEGLIRAVVSGSDTVESAGNQKMRAYLHGNTAIDTGWLVMRGRCEWSIRSALPIHGRSALPRPSMAVIAAQVYLDPSNR